MQLGASEALILPGTPFEVERSGDDFGVQSVSLFTGHSSEAFRLFHLLARNRNCRFHLHRLEVSLAVSGLCSFFSQCRQCPVSDTGKESSVQEPPPSPRPVGRQVRDN